MKTCAIVGINWGDEGKGRMVDLLTQDYDIVVRYQGGGNAGHTVINEYGKFALHLLPSGIFRPNVVNILGNGVALDMKSLCGEMENVTAKGVSVTPENLKISDRASLVLPWHILLDELEEERLKDKKYGSTKQGIAPFYSDKYQKKTIQAGELFYPEYLVRHLEDLLEWKNLTLTGVYGAKPYTMAQLCDYLHTYGQKLRPFICDTGSWLRKAQQDGKSILFEAQLGALREPAGSIQKHHVIAVANGMLHSGLGNVHRIGLAHLEHRQTQLLAADLQLPDGGGAVDVTGHQ